MSRQEAYNQYQAALKAGQKEYKRCVARGKYPYPQVLDEILDDSMIAGRYNVGLVEIPAEQIIGTKSAGRRDAFAANFMPLLSEKSEFAVKWVNLCAAHLDEGIRDPIRCFEYLGRFYVQEGNKRVSVLKSYGASSIPGYVVRLVPVWSQEPEVQLYYEFLHAYQLTGLYQLTFTQFGSFPKLQSALGHEADYVWNEEDRRRFLSGYTYFKRAFSKLGGDRLRITLADAMLVWLKVYPYEQLKIETLDELEKSISSVWQDILMIGRTAPIAVSTAPEAIEEEKGLFSRLRSAMFPGHLHAAMINEHSPDVSNWVKGHVQGMEYARKVMRDKLSVQIFNGVGNGDSAVAAMETAIRQGAQVLFVTTAPLIGACRRIAAKYPDVRVLNCSVSMPYTGVRTYYSRIYEGKFLTGAIAGAMSQTDTIGYIASYPIFGVPAAINAFALGAQMTNPRAKIKLLWSCVPGEPLRELAEQNVEFISTLDIPSADSLRGKRGMCRLEADGSLRLLASPYWDWGTFYTKLLSSIMNGGWDLAGKHSQRAVNYWWGMSGGVIGMKYAPELPAGVSSLVQILQRGITDGSIEPFHRVIRSQDGTLRNDGSRSMTAEEILQMDWLCEHVEGEIPAFERLLPEARPIVRMQGIYRDKIPPEPEGVLL